MADVQAMAAALRPQMSGDVLQAEHPEYDSCRRVHNGMIDRRPGLIARCRGVADVQAAVRAARDHGMEIAVRGGGHNVAGKAVCDGGLMIDLAGMRSVHVDPHALRARAEGGATWGDYNRETQVFGLASTGGVVSSTGVAGLTLGGGLGWLMGKQGMAVDTVRAATLVTASGDVVRTSTHEHPDLFWAIRGGGGNFGVAAWLEFEVAPVGPIVTGGLIAFPFAVARDVLRYYRDLTADLPDEMSVFAGLVHAPDGSGAKLAAIIVCHCGDLESGRAASAPFKRLKSPAIDAIGPMSYSAVNTLFDGGFPRGALNYWKSSFLAALGDAAIDQLIAQFEAVPSPMSALLLEHFHGAATRVAPGATAFPHRAVGYNLLIVSEWMATAQSVANIAWARDSYAAMSPHLASGRYVNYLNADELNQSDAVVAAFGPNAQRLRQVKQQYDPDNVFHLNQNITP